MIQKERPELQFILNDSPEPPRLLTVPKRDLRRFLVTLPLAILTLLALVAGVAILRPSARHGSLGIPSLPSLSTDGGKVQELKAELAALTASNQALQKKLASPPTGGAVADVWLGPVKRPYALQDLRGKNELRLESITLEATETKQVLRFNLVNHGSSSQRVTGHVYVLQLHDGGMGLYPAATAGELAQGMRFDQGESFAVSRLRPVEAAFAPVPDSRFLVIVFTREGDLLVHQELTGPFPAPGGAP